MSQKQKDAEFNEAAKKAFSDVGGLLSGISGQPGLPSFITNPLVEGLIKGEQSADKKRVDAQMRQGKSKEEAEEFVQHAKNLEWESMADRWT